jgi:phosphate transport system substrate-binding protein
MADLPPRKITVVVRQDGSGTTYHFSNHLSAISSEWKARHGAKRKIGWPGTFSQQPQNEGVAGTVVNTIGAIGYADLGTALQARDRIKMARLQNKAGEYVEPTPLNATLALAAAKDVTSKPAFVPDPDGKDHYPIVGFTYVMVYREYGDDKRLAAMKELLQRCLTDGQNDCERLGYVRLAPNTAAEALQMVKKLGL